MLAAVVLENLTACTGNCWKHTASLTGVTSICQPVQPKQIPAFAAAVNSQITAVQVLKCPKASRAVWLSRQEQKVYKYVCSADKLGRMSSQEEGADSPDLTLSKVHSSLYEVDQDGPKTLEGLSKRTWYGKKRGPQLSEDGSGQTEPVPTVKVA